MVIREWRAVAEPGSVQGYRQHFHSKVLPQLRQIAGFAGAHLAQRRRDDAIELLVLTRWQSLDAIRAFAGDDPEVAIVEPEAAAVLIAFDGHVRHYDVIEEA
ncbi:MAG: antibiotic biosynthesis monooxygenase [Hyphomicrobiaceae bacterium]|nr:antibiotic biosynthesis monooxygenase [Hyphomicrobiaceae bacterium]